MTSKIMKAKKYQKEREILRLVELFLTPVILLLVTIFPISKSLSTQASEWIQNPYAGFAIYFLMYALVILVLDFPLSVYSGYALEKKYDLSNHTLGTWGMDFLKKSLLSFMMSLLLLETLYFFIWNASGQWWIYSWIGYAFFSYVMGKLFPVLIVPLFYKYQRLEEGTLKKRIMSLASRYGLALENVYSMNLSRTTRKANAAFMGIGRTKRVVLSDTLLKNFSEDEIEVVVAHELGHFKHRDIWKQLTLSMVFSFAGFWIIQKIFPGLALQLGFAGIADRAALPLLFLLFYGFFLILMPLQHGISRMIERAADKFALKAFPNTGAFISSMEKLAAVNLADPNPHPLVEWFFYDHPAISKRIAMARTQKARVTGTLVPVTLLFFAASSLHVFAAEEEKDSAAAAIERRQEVEIKSYFLQDPQKAKLPTSILAVQFYNQAIQYFEKSEYDLAKQALQEAVMQDPSNSLAYELLGDVHNVQQDLAEAKLNYEFAYNLQPNAALKSKLEKLRSETQVEKKLSTYKEEHFLIKYHNQDKSMEGFELRELLRETYRNISRDFAYYFKNQLVVILYDEEDFRAISNAPHWAGGVYDGKVRMPVSRKGFAETDLKAVTAHEVTHAFVAQMSVQRAPAWLNEGLAQYQENKSRPLDMLVFDAAIKTKTLLPLDQIMNERSLESRTDPLWINLFYRQSFHLTNYLVKRYGFYYVKLMLGEFAKGKSSNEVVENVLKISVPKLEKEWRATF